MHTRTYTYVCTVCMHDHSFIHSSHSFESYHLILTFTQGHTSTHVCMSMNSQPISLHAGVSATGARVMPQMPIRTWRGLTHQLAFWQEVEAKQIRNQDGICDDVWKEKRGFSFFSFAGCVVCLGWA